MRKGCRTPNRWVMSVKWLNSFVLRVKTYIAESVSKQPIFHWHKLSHNVVIGELGSSTNANDDHTADESGDAVCSCAYDAADQAAGCTTYEDPSTMYVSLLFEIGACGRICHSPSTEDIRHATNDEQGNGTCQSVYQGDPNIVGIL